jgi:hypothetical protein
MRDFNSAKVVMSDTSNIDSLQRTMNSSACKMKRSGATQRHAKI